jgi:formylglycine-generating enzyme required for sulfatase activity
MQPPPATACTRALLVAVSVVAVLAPGCNSILGNESASVVPPSADAAVIDAGLRPEAAAPVDASSSDSDAPEASLVGDAGACPQGKGPDMVNVANLFCIDGTEVTIAQYARFLALGLSPGSQKEPAPACSFNASYAPGGTGYDPAAPGSDPVAYVNWCDAFAYCAWAGKRLCGQLGGGATTESTFATLENEHIACSASGTRTYPYGNTFSMTACNGNAPSGAVLPAGKLSTCEGGFPGLFDMVGNVEEWQDGCATNAGPMDSCAHGTGSFEHGVPACAYYDDDARSYQFADVGIRCCASLQ